MRRLPKSFSLGAGGQLLRQHDQAVVGRTYDLAPLDAFSDSQQYLPTNEKRLVRMLRPIQSGVLRKIG